MTAVRVVVRHAAGQHLGFPGARGEFAPLQLADDLERAVHAVQLRAGVQVLPAAEEGVELGGGNGFDLAAQAPDGETVNPRQQAAVAPFHLTGRAGELAAQNLAFGFELRQRLVHQVTRHGQIGGDLRRAQRPRAFEPAAQNLGGAGFGRFGNGTAGRSGDGRMDSGLRVDAADQVESLGGNQEIAAIVGESGGAVGGDERGESVPR